MTSGCWLARCRAVYLFEKDTGTTSSCYGACAGTWPPVLTTGSPLTGSGATASLLGTAKRTDGTTQVTYAGHPLYYFAGDQNPGDISGEGSQSFGAGWDLIAPAGKKVEKPGA
jgi:predicted lipoprotein with Yx(FWY)xxD motif